MKQLKCYFVRSQEKGTGSRPDVRLARSVWSCCRGPSPARSALFPVPAATPRPPPARVGPGPMEGRPAASLPASARGSAAAGAQGRPALRPRPRKGLLGSGARRPPWTSA